MQKILIVDDDESIRMLYADELHDDGYSVITCGDGSRLLDTIRKERPDLVVMDIRLGRYNGLDLLQSIRYDHNDLPIILCSAHPDFARDQTLVDFDQCLVKSSNLEELKKKIETILG